MKMRPVHSLVWAGATKPNISSRLLRRTLGWRLEWRNTWFWIDSWGLGRGPRNARTIANRRYWRMLLLTIGLLILGLLLMPPLFAKGPANNEWQQMTLAGGITINQAVPRFLEQAWEAEIAANDRYYKMELKTTPESNPELFVRGHAPNYFLYREYKLPGRTIVISTMFSSVTCDRSRFTGEYSYQLCQAKIIASDDAHQKTSVVPRVCFYDVSEDPDYQQQAKPNGLFVKVDEKANAIHFMAWEKGKALTECAAQSQIP
jgi:hypothetical protein